MRYNTLGLTGLMVSELCLGTMTFGVNEGREAVVRRYAANGLLLWSAGRG